jgi:hypothetical protein
MTITAARFVPADRSTSTSRRAVPLIAAASVMMRLPGLGHALRPDEAGFLAVAQQWHAGGSSLYGSYWVDRPPLLISIFGVAAQLGGSVPPRLIGCVAVACVVVGVAHVARWMARDRAAAWWARLASLACEFLADAAVLVVVMPAWTLAHGTSLSGVYFAMYPFRVAAGHVLAGSTGSQATSRRRTPKPTPVVHRVRAWGSARGRPRSCPG